MSSSLVPTAPVCVASPLRPDRSSTPGFSPDGRLIAYRDSRHGINEDDEVWVMDRDGRHARNLTRDHGNDWSPAWSPDGRTIAFASTRSGALELWTMAADGRAPQARVELARRVPLVVAGRVADRLLARDGRRGPDRDRSPRRSGRARRDAAHREQRASRLVARRVPDRVQPRLRGATDHLDDAPGRHRRARDHQTRKRRRRPRMVPRRPLHRLRPRPPADDHGHRRLRPALAGPRRLAADVDVVSRSVARATLAAGSGATTQSSSNDEGRRRAAPLRYGPPPARTRRCTAVAGAHEAAPPSRAPRRATLDPMLTPKVTELTRAGHARATAPLPPARPQSSPSEQTSRRVRARARRIEPLGSTSATQAPSAVARDRGTAPARPPVERALRHSWLLADPRPGGARRLTSTKRDHHRVCPALRDGSSNPAARWSSKRHGAAACRAKRQPGSGARANAFPAAARSRTGVPRSWRGALRARDRVGLRETVRSLHPAGASGVPRPPRSRRACRGESARLGDRSKRLVFEAALSTLAPDAHLARRSSERAGRRRTAGCSVESVGKRLAGVKHGSRPAESPRRGSHFANRRLAGGRPPPPPRPPGGAGRGGARGRAAVAGPPPPFRGGGGPPGSPPRAG